MVGNSELVTTDASWVETGGLDGTRGGTLETDGLDESWLELEGDGGILK